MANPVDPNRGGMTERRPAQAGRTAFPGFATPAAGFDEPFEMLSGCHERVERTLGLLARLVPYVHERGVDDVAANAASDILRYFDLAAPRHHEDEERHVFPEVLRGADEVLKAQVRRLQGDHRAMTEAWALLRLQLVVLTTKPEALDVAALSVASAKFSGLYDEHIRIENSIVFPAARASMSPAQLTAMSVDMQQRRLG